MGSEKMSHLIPVMLRLLELCGMPECLPLITSLIVLHQYTLIGSHG